MQCCVALCILALAAALALLGLKSLSSLDPSGPGKDKLTCFELLT